VFPLRVGHRFERRQWGGQPGFHQAVPFSSYSQRPKISFLTEMNAWPVPENYKLAPGRRQVVPLTDDGADVLPSDLVDTLQRPEPVSQAKLVDAVSKLRG
jgi:hypothetical protein